jgi:predicted DNA-binding transcriptional regulator YafY
MSCLNEDFAMRASRLLQILLLLQNRGRMTSAALAEELEVARRTILRDVDALTEAGLPVIVHQGNQGGIELGFNYRTRLTGLAADEAEALAVVLGRPAPELDALGMRQAGSRAVGKLLESLPDRVRETVQRAMARFRFDTAPDTGDDPRLPALAQAVRGGRIVTVNARSSRPRRIHPVALVCGPAGWRIEDALAPDQPVPLAECGDINISAKRF